MGKLRVTQQLAPKPNRHLCEGTACTASGLGGGPGGGSPSPTLRGFFSNEETAQNFLYATAAISFNCKHDAHVDFGPKQPKIRLFLPRF